MTDTEAGTVAVAVEQRDRSRGVVARAKAAQDWFGILGPSHANPAAFVQLSLAQLSKVRDLREAAEANPAEFLSVMAECARLGLMPGSTFFYIPFKSKHPPYWSIAGIIHWTGEVDLMYRTGVVSAVVVQEVRAGDLFAWDPTAMAVPEHRIPPAGEQLGLAEAGDRGKITGVYCYVRFKDGTTSFPTVMTAGEVGKHRKISRAGEDFWGKWNPAEGKTAVTDEGPWTVDMVKKTAVHKHRPSVPSSPEYMQQVAASMARALKDPPEGVSIQPADQPAAVDYTPPGLAIEGNGHEERPTPGTIVGQVTGGDRGKPMNKGDALNRIADTFRAAGLGAPEWRATAVKIAASLSMPEGEPAPQIARLSDLRADQARTAAQRLDDVMVAVGGDAGSARDTILRAALDDRLWDGTDPPAPEGFVIDADDVPPPDHGDEDQ